MFLNPTIVPNITGITGGVTNPHDQPSTVNAVPATLNDAAAPTDILKNIQTIFQENRECVLVAAAAGIVVSGLYATDQISGTSALLITVGAALLGLASNRVKPVLAHTVAVEGPPPERLTPLTADDQSNDMHELPSEMRTRTARGETLPNQPPSTSPNVRSVLSSLTPETLGSATAPDATQTNIRNAHTGNRGSVLSYMAKTLAVGGGGALYGIGVFLSSGICQINKLIMSAPGLLFDTSKGLGYLIKGVVCLALGVATIVPKLLLFTISVIGAKLLIYGSGREHTQDLITGIAKTMTDFMSADAIVDVFRNW